MRRVRSDTLRVYREADGMAWLARSARPPGDQALLPWQIPLLARWFTPVMWTAYILLADAWVLRREGRSLLRDRPREAFVMATVSIPLWLLFEGYNVRLRNWAYFGVPESPWVAAIAYAWAFATIWPAMFETAALLGAGPFPALPARRPVPLSAGLRLAILVGAAFVTVPLMLPSDVRPWTFGFVWLGFVLLLDSLNARAGRPSLPGRVARGRPGVRLAVARRRHRLRRPLGVLELLGAGEVALRGRSGLPFHPALRDAPRRISRVPAVRSRGVCAVSSGAPSGRAVRP